MSHDYLWLWCWELKCVLLFNRQKHPKVQQQSSFPFAVRKPRLTKLKYTARGQLLSGGDGIRTRGVWFQSLHYSLCPNLPSSVFQAGKWAAYWSSHALWEKNVYVSNWCEGKSTWVLRLSNKGCRSPPVFQHLPGEGSMLLGSLPCKYTHTHARACAHTLIYKICWSCSEVKGKKCEFYFLSMFIHY